MAKKKGKARRQPSDGVSGFADDVIEFYETCGFTRLEFADSVGVSLATVTKWLKGRPGDPSYSTVAKFAEAIGKRVAIVDVQK